MRLSWFVLYQPSPTQCLTVTVQEGMTVAWTMRFPENWPDTELDVRLASNTDDGALFCTLALTRSGNLAVAFEEDGEVTQSWLFPRLLGFEGQPSTIIFRLTPDGIGDLFQNGTKLSSIEPGSTEAVQFTEVSWSLRGQASDEPEATGACQDWIDWRAEWARPRPPRSGRRLKTAAETTAELSEAVEALELHLVGIRAGNRALIGDVTSRLRALVYWDADRPDNPAYSPLLLRTAGRAGIALPVWANAPERWGMGILAEAAYALPDTRPYIEQRMPGQRVMDLQQTLMHVVQIDRTDPTLTMTLLEAIGLAANTQAVHHDEAIPLPIDRLSDQVFIDRDLLEDVIVSLGDVVAALGRFTISHVEPPA